MITRRAALGGLAAAALPRAAGWRDAEGRVRIVGYNDMAEMVAALDRAFEAAHPHLRFAADLKSTRSGPPALAAGTALLALMGAAFTPEQLATYRAATGGDPAGFRIAHASLDPKALSGPNGVFVHRDNPLAAADLRAVARVFTQGGQHRWGELGARGDWPERPLHAAGLSPETPLALEMQAAAFPGRAFAEGYRRFVQSRDVIGLVAEDPLALGFAALNRGDGRVRALALSPPAGGVPVAATRETLQAGRYPLDRWLWVYARTGPGGRLETLARAWLAFALSSEGQAIVGAGTLGYLPLGPRELARERASLG